MRPGEKLFEELAAMEESTLPTSHEKIKMFWRPPAVAGGDARSGWRSLRRFARRATFAAAGADVQGAGAGVQPERADSEPGVQRGAGSGSGSVGEDHHPNKRAKQHGSAEKTEEVETGSERGLGPRFVFLGDGERGNWGIRETGRRAQKSVRSITREPSTWDREAAEKLSARRWRSITVAGPRLRP